MEKIIKTGIYGLDELLGGGFRENTINLVYGGTGVGKTTFGLQYALFGLNRGESVVFISFEMTEQQIIRDCRSLGWTEIEEHLDQGNLKIIQIFGEDMMFPSLDLVEHIKTSIDYGEISRIVIDPLTYMTFYLNKEKRKNLSMIFQGLRDIGTSVITLEESLFNAQPQLHDIIMPLYLADTVIQLHNLGFGEMYNRTLRIVKHRGSRHGEGLYPYTIENGLGIVVEASKKQIDKVKPKTIFDGVFKKAEEKAKEIGGDLGARLVVKINALRQNWTREESPENVLKLLFETEEEIICW